MKKEMLSFIEENQLSIFNSTKTRVNNKGNIFKTNDSRKTKRDTLKKLSEKFNFADTSNMFDLFYFNTNKEEIVNRQKFFKKIKSLGKKENYFLKEIKKPSPEWKPEYDVVVVTENSETFNKLKKMNCPAQLILSENDLELLKERDIVQILDTDEYSIPLESLPQGIFLDSMEEVYLERHLEKLSAWQHNIELLLENNIEGQLKQTAEELSKHFYLLNNENSEITESYVEEKLMEINSKIEERAKDLSVSGESLISMINRKELPKEIKNIAYDEIRKTGIPEEIFNIEIPLTVDEQSLDELINKQNTNKFSDQAEKIKENANEIKNIPEKIKLLADLIIIYDFIAGISQYICETSEEKEFPEITEHELDIKNSKNILLFEEGKVQPISFNLNQETRCSILTGANSGGKTTLVEHIIQIMTLAYTGLPVIGKVKLPIFTEVYYFAKNKGAASKGAFENLLEQMSRINTGDKTLILADEIEAVTEPGVAGNIIAGTAQYFIERNCYLIVATHLGHEIKSFLPEKTRIDGIEAKGLDKEFNLIVDHNPVLGRLANSTPELIVEKMANTLQKDYFKFINEYLKKTE